MKKPILTRILPIALVVALCTQPATANPGAGGNDPFDDGDPGTQVPIDGGSVALAGAAIYLWKRKRTKAIKS